MLGVMSKRPRMMFDCTEAMRRAVNIRAAKFGMSPSEVIVAALVAFLDPKEIKEAEEAIRQSGPPSSKRGRKPRPGGSE